MTYSTHPLHDPRYLGIPSCPTIALSFASAADCGFKFMFHTSSARRARKATGSCLQSFSPSFPCSLLYYLQDHWIISVFLIFSRSRSGSSPLNLSHLYSLPFLPSSSSFRPALWFTSSTDLGRLLDPEAWARNGCAAEQRRSQQTPRNNHCQDQPSFSEPLSHVSSLSPMNSPLCDSIIFGTSLESCSSDHFH